MEQHRDERAPDAMSCRDPRDEAEREQERRDKVRAASERVRAENRDILNRLATK